MNLIETESFEMVENGSTVSRIARQMSLVGRIDRFAQLHGNICQLLIGKYDTQNDLIITNHIVGLFDLFCIVNS